MSEPCRVIRIVTGTGGRVQGSKVYLDGQELPELSYVEIKGEVTGQWEIETIRVLQPARNNPQANPLALEGGANDV